MSDRAPYDDFRDLIEGRLGPECEARLRAQLASDPALAAEFAAFGEVHAFTSAACAPPPCEVAFDEIDAARGPAPVRRLRPWMAAAALLVAVTAGAALWRANTPHTVTLRAIRLDLAADVRPASPGAVPQVLAGYRPIQDDRIQWIDSLDTGREVALATNRPIFLWIHHPQCPVCIAWDRELFRREEIDAKATQFVPVRLDVMKAPEHVQRLCEKGWPYLGVLGADGVPVVEFAGEQTASELAAHLTSAAEVQTKLGAPIAWEAASEAASALRRGAAAQAGLRYAEAHREFEAAAALAGSGPLHAAADAGVRDVALVAATELIESKKLAETDEAAGARRLSEAVERFRGTPYGLDLAEVEQELRATGRFPALVQSAKASQ